MTTVQRPTGSSEHIKESSRSFDNLALMYQGLLTGIVRMQAGRQHVSNGELLRKRTKTALQEVEREAIAAGYDRMDIRDTHFAVAAFLDSVVLNSAEPIRAEWERQTLQQELFGQTDAGEVFFEKIDNFRSRQDSPRLADILEVYLLCLFLGFEGKYSGHSRGELFSITERLRMRIADIRGKSSRLAPTALPLPASIKAETVQTVKRDLYGVFTVVAIAVAVLTYIVSKLYLLRAAEQISSRL